MKDRGKAMKKNDFILFMLASAVLGISQSIDSSVFNNFLNDTFHIAVTQRALLEIPREFPGFMVVFVSGILLFLGDARIAAVANILAAVGMMGLGLLSSSYGIMIVCLTVYSMGQHLFMPVSNSIVMNLSNKSNMGKRLGQINGLNTAVFLITSLATALVFKNIKVNYKAAFVVGSLAFLVSSILITFMTPHKEKKKTKRLIIKKEYTLFYVLSILYGARKQIFITFGPWVLIKEFGQGVSTFALLGFFIAGIGMFFKPALGYLIDKFGERYVLAGEAVSLILICLGYAFSRDYFVSIGKESIALYFICGCYIIDQLLAAASMARSTYLKKIAVVPEDVSPTLSMGISIDHMVSMTIPFLGGYLWTVLGYKYVFIGGAVIALINLFAASRINTSMISDLKQQVAEIN
jgi:MFS family permease